MLSDTGPIGHVHDQVSACCSSTFVVRTLMRVVVGIIGRWFSWPKRPGSPASSCSVHRPRPLVRPPVVPAAGTTTDPQNIRLDVAPRTVAARSAVWCGICVGVHGGCSFGVVTFLVTDVEGSTRRWEADAEGMRAALAAHDEVLRSAIEGHGGWLFKHTGDGVCAAFASPRSAVDAAVAAQRELQLPVRMGLATGEAELRDSDYFGTVLDRAARVMATGHGGQILLADSTAVLLSGVDLIDLGPDDCGTCRRRSGSSKCVRRVSRRIFRRCGHSIRVREICGVRRAA